MPARGREREMPVPVPVPVCLPHAALPPGNPRQPKTELQRSGHKQKLKQKGNKCRSVALVACQRGSSRLALGRLANVGGALRSQAQTRVSLWLPPSLALLPTVDCL